VLAPYVEHRLAELTPFAPITDWLLFRWICLFASLLAGHVYFRTWYSDSEAVAGNALVAALLPLTFTNSWPNPDQFTELALFTLAAACIARRWWPAFLALLAVNAVNRETSAFLLLLFALAEPITPLHATRCAGAAFVWAAITVGLRWRLGFASYDPWQLARNLSWLVPLPANFPGYKRVYGWFFIVLLWPCLHFAYSGWRRQPRFMRVSAGVVAPLYIVTCLLFSSTIESRIFTPILPLLVPSMLATLFGTGTAERRPLLQD
jgi:hypothetical protein